MPDDKIEVLNVNVPDHVSRVDRTKYEAMREAIVQVAPKAPPGMTGKEMKEAAIPLLPHDLFPEGKTSGWWQKTVQLDLEARGLMARSDKSPLRFWLTQ